MNLGEFASWLKEHHDVADAYPVFLISGWKHYTWGYKIGRSIDLGSSETHQNFEFECDACFKTRYGLGMNWLDALRQQKIILLESITVWGGTGARGVFSCNFPQIGPHGVALWSNVPHICSRIYCLRLLWECREVLLASVKDSWQIDPESVQALERFIYTPIVSLVTAEFGK